MSVKLLTEHHLEVLSLKGGCTGTSESTLVKCHIVGNHMSRLILLCNLSSAFVLVQLLVSCIGQRPVSDTGMIFKIETLPAAPSPFCIPVTGQC